MLPFDSMYIEDNLLVLSGLNTNSVDLIYLDPPFNSKRMYKAPTGSKAAGAQFKDMWTWDDVDDYRLEKMYQDDVPIYRLIETVQAIHGKAMASYLTFMYFRIKEMHRVLKDTGSIYLHCDPTASHYLKLLMDYVFGVKNFRNEIIWGYAKPRPAKKMFVRNHDVILFYAKSDMTTFNPQRMPNLKGEFIMRKPIKRPDGTVWHPTEPGVLAGSWWHDIPSFSTRMTAKERTGYPTQKPLALLERIISASSNEGDIVLDPFCGCATTCVAAQRLNRRWIGIDVSDKAGHLVDMRIKSEGVFSNYKIYKNIPKRSDSVEENLKDPKLKNRLYEKADYKCTACRTFLELRHLEIDHIIPKKVGGTNHFDNLQLLCGNCNRCKGSKPDEFFKAKLKKQQSDLQAITY